MSRHDTMMQSPRARNGAVTLRPDDVLGGAYTISQILGRGAMADVYAAYDVRLRRRVAIKLSRRGIDSQYLESEGQLLGGVRHPGVVSVHDIGRWHDRSYLVLERLFGTTLQRQLDLRRGRPFPVATALEFLIQLCDTLSCLHHIGVIHRDLKPDNIMCSPGGKLVLFDLGVAAGRLDGATSEQVVGTPAYLAPELLSSTPTPSAAQDIYALGCLAFQLLSGRLPFDGSTANDMLRSHLDDPVPELPADLEGGDTLRDLVATMLAKHPADRPASARVLSGWLRGVLRSLERGTEQPTSILVVDDDADARALLTAIIEQRLDGIDVRTAVDGLDALDQVTERPPSVMLLDLEMPRLSGVELCMHLASLPAADDMLMCVFSGWTDRADRQLLETLGVDRFIDKAAPTNLLISDLEELVRDVELRRSTSRPPVLAHL